MDCESFVCPRNSMACVGLCVVSRKTRSRKLDQSCGLITTFSGTWLKTSRSFCTPMALLKGATPIRPPTIPLSSRHAGATLIGRRRRFRLSQQNSAPRRHCSISRRPPDPGRQVIVRAPSKSLVKREAESGEARRHSVPRGRTLHDKNIPVAERRARGRIDDGGGQPCCALLLRSRFFCNRFLQCQPLTPSRSRISTR
jgi:hypothetical protein